VADGALRSMFRRILIANRGEIAVRVMRSCREMGIETVAVYSDADAAAVHVGEATRAERIGPPAPRDSYLNVGAIIDAARRSGAEAIHPGYGFLSENAAFAAACADAGVVFVGPPPGAIEQMGSKIEARRLMQASGVPVVPGETPDSQEDSALLAAVDRVGFPALLKPSSGGGGIGMQVIRRRDEAAAAIQSARRNAEAAFGDGTLYVERLVERPRHVEIQIFADDHGNVTSLFERECSLQRRQQKVIEESPSPALTPELRTAMGEAAIAAARACGYRNAGTIEFLLDESSGKPAFYFMEMNTRLQVEHPVTEQVVGVDLVRAQLLVAAGQALPWRADQLRQRGHAFECRIYAEHPTEGFLPQSGPVLLYREPAGPGIRIDSGVREGGSVPVHYDPLIAKLIVSAESRALALARLDRALSEFAILGIETNVAFLRALVNHHDVRAGRIHTRFIEATLDELLSRCRTDTVPDEVAVGALLSSASPVAQASTGESPDPWRSLTGWRN
jgi:acetyl-CoA/propionyl-CoA carboxylase, biotin carboxylase, biotin carboxyl carrier protein